MFLFIRILNKKDIISRCEHSGELDDKRMEVEGLLCPMQSSQKDVSERRHSIESDLSLRLDSAQEVVYGSYGSVKPDTALSDDDWNGKMYWFLPIRLLPKSERLQSRNGVLVDLLEGLVLEEVDLGNQVFRRYGLYSARDAFPEQTYYHIHRKTRPRKPAKPWPLPSRIRVSSCNLQHEWPETEAKAVADELFHGHQLRTITLI